MEFKEHFRNVTRIMDCISCERCKLWGKVQTTGIGTALKIHFMEDNGNTWNNSNFRRAELISLFNTLGRFSESITAVEKFRENSIRKSRQFSVIQNNRHYQNVSKVRHVYYFLIFS